MDYLLDVQARPRRCLHMRPKKFILDRVRELFNILNQTRIHELFKRRTFNGSMDRRVCWNISLHAVAGFEYLTSPSHWRRSLAQTAHSHQDQHQAIHLFNEKAHFTRHLERLEGLATNVSSSLGRFTWRQPI